MHTLAQLCGQNVVHQALALDTRFACETVRYDYNVEMRLALTVRVIARMAGVTRRVVNDFQRGGLKSVAELGFHPLAVDAHGDFTPIHICTPNMHTWAK